LHRKKTNMKQILLVAVALTVVNFVTAQCSTKNTDAEAKKVLDGVSKKYKSFSSVSANFSIKSETAGGKALSSKAGTLTAKGNKYKVSITGQDIYCDGTTVWTYDKAANEVTITKFDATKSSITPQTLFTNFYDKDFLYKLNGEKAEAGKTMQEIEMTPCNKTRPYSKVYVYVDKAGSTIAKTKVLEKSTNNKFIMSVTKLTPNAAASDASFKFDKSKYPGVEEIDLR
jgi:outer membrane lipoprotein carrier protein